ncbi:ecotin precursor [Paraburkholderia adhaesiva]|uniref:ecotin precursor n=1 Tax=Paraburkholderia adhaesiva TaxID=2883244 RepID=UPI001F47F8A5|nr:ecotin precursor [Paraburkholderia adhaesiva]
MRKMVAVLALAGSMAVAGPASAHGHDGGDVVGALLGGALIGAVVGAAINGAPAVAYQAPPVYAAAPVYAPAPPAPVYAAAPSGGYCYDQYSRNYVPCAPAQPAPPPPPYGAYPQQPAW